MYFIHCAKWGARYSAICMHHQKNQDSLQLIMKEEQQPLQPLSEKKEPLMNESVTESNKLSKKATKSLEQYRKKLLAQIITIFLICLIVILERVFYQIIVEAEERTLSSFQLNTDLISKDDNDTITAEGITNGFLKFFGSLSQFPIQFLFLTHVLATLYVAFDAILATKVIFVSMATIYFVSVLQLFYAGARPFWANKQIFASCCLQSYSHPSLGLILTTFVPYYAYYIWRKKTGSKVGVTPLKHIFGGIAIAVLSFVTQFMNYMIGTLYIINIVMSLVISTLLMMVAIAGNAVIEAAVKKSTILKTDAKKYVFYWLLLICLLGTFVMIVYSGEDLFLDIDWVDSFMHCTRYQHYTDQSYRYDEIIGPWFNFTQTATLFAWIGAVFGISAAFRGIPHIEWAGGSLKNRISRAVIANILIIPSWFFILLAQNQGTWILDIGLNAFIVNSLHFFLLYIWIFGYMPIVLLHRVLKLTNRQDEQLYVIVDHQDSKPQI